MPGKSQSAVSERICRYVLPASSLRKVFHVNIRTMGISNTQVPKHQALNPSLFTLAPLVPIPRTLLARSTALLSFAPQSSLLTLPCPRRRRLRSTSFAFSVLHVPATQSHRQPGVGHAPSPSPDSLNQLRRQAA